MEWHDAVVAIYGVQLTRQNGQKSPLLNGKYTLNSKLEFKSNQFYKIGWNKSKNWIEDGVQQTDKIEGLAENLYFKLQPNQFVVGIKVYDGGGSGSCTRGLEFRFM